MRKIFRIIAGLVSVMSIPVIPVSANGRVFYQETYEDITTNDIPEYDFYAENIHVTERVKGSDKAVEMTSSDGELNIERSFNAVNENFTLKLDMAILKNICEGEISVLTGSGKTITILNIDKNHVTTHDSKNLFDLSADYSTLSMSFDLKNKRYSVSKNSKNVISNWYLSTMPDSIAGFKIKLLSSNADEFGVGFDNVLVYTGNEKLKKPKYNNDEINFVPEEKTSAAVTVPLINSGFDQGYGIQGVSAAAGENEVGVITDDSGNGFVRLNKMNDTDCYIQVQNAEGYPKNLVIEYDVRATGGVGGGVIARDEKAGFNWVSTINQGNTVTAGSKILGKTKEEKWTRVRMILNFKKNTITAYYNGQLVEENFPMSTINSADVTILRIGAFSGTGIIDIDNLLVYEGKALKKFDEVDKSVRVRAFKEDADAIGLIGDGVAVSVKSGTIFANGKKQTLDVAPFIENGYTYIPVRAIGEALNYDIEWSAEDRTVTVGNNIEFKVGDTKVKKGNDTVQCENTVKIVSNRVFMPLRDLCEKLLGKRVFWDDHGLIIISDTNVRLNSTQVLSVFDYMTYDRPDVQTLLDDYLDMQMQGVHPRLLVTQSDFDRLKKYYDEGNATIRDFYEKLSKSADQVLVAKLPEPATNLMYSLGIPQSGIINVETLAIMYRMTGDRKYLNRVWEIINVICTDFEDWYVESKYLTTSETTAMVGIAYDWLYDEWTDEQKSIMEDAIMEKSLQYADKTFYSQTGNWQDFTILANNWNCVCSGGTLMGACAIFDKNPDFCADIIRNCVRSVELAIKNYYPVGGWMEGTSYWEYATKYFVNMLSTLENTFGTDFNLSKAPGFSNTGIYAISTQGPNGTLGEHDNGRAKLIPYPNFYLANKFGDSGLGAFKIYSMKKEKSDPIPMDLLWYRDDFDREGSVLNNDYYYSGTSSKVVMREKWNDDEATFLGYHIDKGAVDHGHFDSGTFVLDMWGECFATELGPEDYEAPEYFGVGRNKFYRTRPEGHNVLVINPDSDLGQQNSKNIDIIKNEWGINSSYSVADLGATYSDDVYDYLRGYMLYNDRRSALVRDELTLKAESDVYWFMQTQAQIEIESPTSAILTKNGKKIRLDFDTNAENFEIMEMPCTLLPTSPEAPERMNANIDYRKVAIKLSAKGKTYLTVRFMRTDDPMYDEEIPNTEISKWTADNSAIRDVPTASAIYNDGELIEDFSKETTSYIVDVPKGHKIPQISVDCNSGADVEIKQSDNVKTPSYVIVTDDYDPRYKLTYTISYNSVVTPENMTKINVEAITSSYEVKDDYIVENLIDGRSDTWFAALGKGQTVLMDFGTVKNIDVIGFDMLYGLRRFTYFTLEVSDDGKNWTKIFDGANSMKTDDMEYIDTEGTSGRYLRYTNFGNSEKSEWMSLVRLEAYGK